MLITVLFFLAVMFMMAYSIKIIGEFIIFLVDMETDFLLNLHSMCLGIGWTIVLILWIYKPMVIT